MNTIAIIIIIILVLIVFSLIRSNRDLEEKNKQARRGINLYTRIIRAANIKNKPPKDLSDDEI